MQRTALPLLISSLLAIPSTSGCTAGSDADADDPIDEDAADSEGGTFDDELAGLGPAPSEASIHDCPLGQLHFNAKCRDTAFFERFLSAGGELGMVSGNRSKLVDTGVVVTETFGDGFVQNVFIGPERVPAGAPLLAGVEYRSSYPVAGRITYSAWVDADSQPVYMETVFGPRPASLSLENPRPASFGVLAWTVHTTTPSGWSEVHSDGTSTAVIASTTAQQACQAQVDVDAADLKLACTLGAGAAAAVAGITAGVGTSLILASSTFGVGTAPAIAGGISLGAGVTAFTGAFGYAACNALSEWRKAHGHAACLNPPNITEAPEVRPVETADAADYSEQECGPGMVSYSGQALYCVDGADDSDFSDGELVVDDNFTCASFSTDGMCILTSAFG